MTKDEALKLALEALDGLSEPYDVLKAQEAIREALAQPEQEPVAWGFQNTAITGSNRWMMLREEIPANDQYGGALWTPLYTTPPQRKPLPKGEWPKHPSGYVGDVYKGYDKSDLDNYAIQVLAAHGIKE